MDGETSSALRDYFGDRKLPDITRKITACVVCRKQKIKCHMQNGCPPCSRCKRRGLSCTVNKSLQMLLESDVDWKNAVIQRLTNLEMAMCKVADATSLHEVHELIQHAETPQPALTRMSEGNTGSPSSSQLRQDERPWAIDIDAVGGPAAIPASHLTERLQGDLNLTKNSYAKFDLIKRGIITLDRAQDLFKVYHDRFDHFLYRILGTDRSFESVQSSSPLLLSAICAVSALQTASADFDKCYQNFLQASSARAFTKECATEDIQAYCIGAFWLSDMSWNLVGAAVRAANQLQLHRSIYQALEGDRESYLRTRLFYLVYICDHHFSIPYGRLPMTGSHSDVILSWRRFQESKHAYEDDRRLAGQVHIWTIYSRIQDTFGINVEAVLPARAIPQARAFVGDFDDFSAQWQESFNTSPYIGNYPNKGVGLHYNFAKLYLCSHVFRGRSTIVFGVVPELDELVQIATTSARSILTALIFDDEIQSYLTGLPSYFSTMITFASVFLLNLAQRYPDIPCIDQKEIFELIERVVETLLPISAVMHEKHLLTSIVHGLEKILAQITDENSRLRLGRKNANLGSEANTEILVETESSWFANPSSNISLWDDYDFLSFQSIPSDFDFNMNSG